MASDKPWLTFRDAAEEIAKGHSGSGGSSFIAVRGAARRLWRAYWSLAFPEDQLRAVLETPFYKDSKRYRPSAAGAKPSQLLRIVGSGRHMPRAALDGEDTARFATISTVDPCLACSPFLEEWFLEIEISQSTFKEWRRRHGAGSRDNGRALLRAWLKQHPETKKLSGHEIFGLAKKAIPGLSERGCLEVLSESGRRRGRPPDKGRK
jgi:hypothetical protein